MAERPTPTEDLASVIRGLTQAISALSLQTGAEEGWERVSEPPLILLPLRVTLSLRPEPLPLRP